MSSYAPSVGPSRALTDPSMSDDGERCGSGAPLNSCGALVVEACAAATGRPQCQAAVARRMMTAGASLQPLSKSSTRLLPPPDLPTPASALHLLCRGQTGRCAGHTRL
jgi:hypothetical protein